MAQEQRETIMAIGGHIGDAELTCGGFLATMALKGYKIVTLALTDGARGNPPHMTVAEYHEQKVAEAKKFAEMLGGEAEVLPYGDVELPDDWQARELTAEMIRKHRPKLVMTHWKGSMHKDHINTYNIVRDAQYLAALVDGKEYPRASCMGPYYAENWEDPEDFHRYLYLEVTEEGFDLWDRAIQNHWFVMNSKDFKYYEYYKHLMAMRGIEARCKYAECFNVDDYTKRVIIGQEDPLNGLRTAGRR